MILEIEVEPSSNKERAATPAQEKKATATNLSMQFVRFPIEAESAD